MEGERPSGLAGRGVAIPTGEKCHLLSLSACTAPSSHPHGKNPQFGGRIPSRQWAHARTFCMSVEQAAGPSFQGSCSWDCGFLDCCGGWGIFGGWGICGVWHPQRLSFPYHSHFRERGCMGLRRAHWKSTAPSCPGRASGASGPCGKTEARPGRRASLQPARQSASSTWGENWEGQRVSFSGRIMLFATPFAGHRPLESPCPEPQTFVCSHCGRAGSLPPLGILAPLCPVASVLFRFLFLFCFCLFKKMKVST